MTKLKFKDWYTDNFKDYIETKPRLNRGKKKADYTFLISLLVVVTIMGISILIFYILTFILGKI